MKKNTSLDSILPSGQSKPSTNESKTYYNKSNKK